MPDTTPQKPVSVLFVCLGNICRSTMCEAVFRSLTTSSTSSSTSPHPLINKIDSCGTGAYHIGSSPDPRTTATLATHGINDYRHAARKFNPKKDFTEFDWIFAMDRENLEDLEDLQRMEGKTGQRMGRVALFGDLGGGGRGQGKGEEVQDPYYGGDEGFEVAYQQAVRLGKAFLQDLEAGELS